MIGFLLVQAFGLVLIPLCRDALWLPGFIVGFGFNGCFAVFQSSMRRLSGGAIVGRRMWVGFAMASG